MFAMLKIAFRNAPKKYLFQQQYLNIILLLSNISYLFFLNTYFPPISTTVAVVMGMVIGCISIITVGEFIRSLLHFWDVMVYILLEKAAKVQTNHLVLSEEEEDEVVEKARKMYVETTQPRRYEVLFVNAAIVMVIINAVLGLGIVWSIHAK